LQGEIYETAKANEVAVGDLFEAGYRLFLDEEQGPRLGPFLAPMDDEPVVERLRREA
jgi:lysyl-tRNA synthetase class 1